MRLYYQPKFTEDFSLNFSCPLKRKPFNYLVIVITISNIYFKPKKKKNTLKKNSILCSIIQVFI